MTVRREGCEVSLGSSVSLKMLPRCMGGNMSDGCPEPTVCSESVDGISGENSQPNVESDVARPGIARPVSGAKMAGGTALRGMKASERVV